MQSPGMLYPLMNIGDLTVNAFSSFWTIFSVIKAIFYSMFGLNLLCAILLVMVTYSRMPQDPHTSKKHINNIATILCVFGSPDAKLLVFLHTGLHFQTKASQTLYN